MKTLADYVCHIARLQAALQTHLVAGAAHKLHFLDASNETCRHRLHQRNSASAHEYQVNDAEFDQFTRYFEPPSPEEGFDLVFYPVS